MLGKDRIVHVGPAPLAVDDIRVDHPYIVGAVGGRAELEGARVVGLPQNASDSSPLTVSCKHNHPPTLQLEDEADARGWGRGSVEAGIDDR
jgi:hypothetical protein